MSHQSFTDTTFKTYRAEVNAQNFAMMKTLSRTFLAIGIVLSAVSAVWTALRASFPIYLCWACISAFTFTICRLARDMARRHATLLLYLLTGTLLVTADISGTVYYQSHNSAFAIGLLAIAPFILLDRPIRIYLFEILMAALFCALSLVWKAWDLSFMDCINCIGISLVACITGTRSTRIKLANAKARANIIRQRDTDPLTELMNRAAAEIAVNRWLTDGTGMAAFLLLDLDHFKEINDTMGHIQGDRVLSWAAATMRRIVPDADCVARLGGDEFLIFIRNTPSRAWVKKQARDLNQALRLTLQMDDMDLSLSASIGITLCRPGQTFQELYNRADMALYRVKEHGRDGFCINPGA